MQRTPFGFIILRESEERSLKSRWFPLAYQSSTRPDALGGGAGELNPSLGHVINISCWGDGAPPTRLLPLPCLRRTISVREAS